MEIKPSAYCFRENRQNKLNTRKKGKQSVFLTFCQLLPTCSCAGNRFYVASARAKSNESFNYNSLLVGRKRRKGSPIFRASVRRSFKGWWSKKETSVPVGENYQPEGSVHGNYPPSGLIWVKKVNLMERNETKMNPLRTCGGGERVQSS